MFVPDRLDREPEIFKDFQVLFSRGAVRSKRSRLEKSYELVDSVRGPLNEGSFVVVGRAYAIFLSWITGFATLELKRRNL